MRLILVTYNIHAGVGGDGRFEPERTVKVLKEIDADIVALQEVEHHTVGGSDLLDYMASAVGLSAIPGPTLLRQTRGYGNALLTRLPVLAVNRIDLSLPRREPRGALDVTLDWGGQVMRVVATHLGLRPGERRAQIRRLLAVFESDHAGPGVLLGDLNEWAPVGTAAALAEPALRVHYAPAHLSGTLAAVRPRPDLGAPARAPAQRRDPHQSAGAHGVRSSSAQGSADEGISRPGREPRVG